MKTEKKNGIFDASFEQSRNLVTDKFIKDEVLKNYRKPNRFNKMLGMLTMPLFFLFLMIAIDENRKTTHFFNLTFSQNGFHLLVNSGRYTLLFLVAIIVIGTIILCWRMRIFMMFFYFMHVLNFIVGGIGLVVESFMLYNKFNMESLIPILYVLLITIFLVIFVYNRHQKTRQILYKSQEFHRIADDFTKRLAQYSGPVILLMMVIKWIFSLFNSSGDFIYQIEKLGAIVLLPVGGGLSAYFGFSYGFYNMFLSYYYLNKYRKEYDLESYLEDKSDSESESKTETD
ncbi:hypothetical protein [Companilactobacillus ginsenosidimutans]|uniref:Uncharacterized protein n=1 Tax=Companilactobacillus ginsenosidimutans TaxID=1007676 RepID=A0A0H4R245_9LACO|nr:hypothetical protein [Companilactobacillus ginsenosidimutans]AKP67810.1 hypothetical protein ABM34_09885 [Companilactobacillus ginsenosidimutans]